MPTDQNKRIAIIGGGISGLAAVHRIVQQGKNVTPVLFEAQDRLGGVIETERRDGFLIEQSADMFTTQEPDAIELCEEIGLADDLISTNQQNRRAFVCFRGKLQPVPPGFVLMSPTQLGSIWKTKLLSPAGKARLCLERFVKRRSDPSDESLQSFAERRFGKQVFQRLIQPLIGGIYTADPSKLSMQATMKQFVDSEREFGSLIAAVLKQKASQKEATASSGARYGKFVAPREGMGQLIDAIADRIPRESIRLNRPVRSMLKAEGGKWRLALDDDEQLFDAVILAVPAHLAAKLLADVNGDLSAALTGIPYASAAIVVQAFPRERVGHPLDGFGFVVPQIENRKILACSFSSVKFDRRAPAGYVLLRTFVGGALQPELLDLSDEALLRLVEDELQPLLSIHGKATFIQVRRWQDAMPQYHVGHLETVRRIEDLVLRDANLTLAGNAFHGVGIPACIRSGRAAADRIINGLSANAAEQSRRS